MSILKNGGYWLFLDDEREPVEKEGIVWRIVRNFNEAIGLINTYGLPMHYQLDHDLGEEKTGYDFVKYLVELDVENNFITKDFSYSIHSQNPVWRGNMDSYLTNYINFKFSHK